MIELTVRIEERDGEVWCSTVACECESATDKELTVFEEDFFPLLDDNKQSDGDGSQLEFDLYSGDSFF